MAKVPQVGRVKTRLARQIGPVRAAWFYRHTAAAVISRLSRHPCWETILSVSPDHDLSHRLWQSRLPRIAQGRGDIGQRMQRAMTLPARGPVVVIGTDIPGIRASHIAHAFKLLGPHDVVFGPAADGGYWLAGQRRRPRCLQMFAGPIRWSTSDVLSDTLRGLEALRVGFVATLSDVDDAEDLRLVAGWCGRRILPLHTGNSPNEPRSG